MIWSDIQDPNDPELDVLAERYHLHPLHIEDCRHGDQRAKVEDGAGYIFVVLKPVHVTDSGELEITDMDVFLGPDWEFTFAALDLELREGLWTTMWSRMFTAARQCIPRAPES